MVSCKQLPNAAPGGPVILAAPPRVLPSHRMARCSREGKPPQAAQWQPRCYGPWRVAGVCPIRQVCRTKNLSIALV